jgi:hypothetical protein
VEKKWLEGVSQGMTIARAAALAGVSTATLTRWRKDITINPGTHLASFFEKLSQAEAEWALGYAEVINDEVTKGKNADLALRMLARRLPEDYGEKREVNVTQTNLNIDVRASAEAKIDEIIGQMEPEQLDGLIRAILQPPSRREGGPGEEVIEGQWKETTAPLHQVPLPRLPTHTSQSEDSGSAGEY